jgi:regulator of sirC expression with transglutaminase-like and TPR domain
MSASLSTAELSALISLLDDPDETVFNQIQDRLLSLGQEVIPHLESAWENSFDPLFQNRIENIIHKIQFDSIKEDLHNWAMLGGQNLLFGTILVARYQYPDLNEEKIKKQIDQIRQDVWLELNNNLTALEKVRVINHILFEVHGFGGNTTNFHAPQNSYINNVLESKRGNPLSLAILYTIIAQSLNIPIFGVNLPEHFIVAYKEEHDFPAITDDLQHGNILFYINPFSKGSVFSRKEIDTFLKQLKLEQDPSYYEPCNNIDIIKRLIRNLIYAFEKLGYVEKMNELKNLITALDS